MDNDKFIEQLNSSTVRAALVIIVANVFAIAKALFDIDLDLDLVKVLTENGVSIGISVITVIAGFKAYKGRLKAKAMIKGEYAEKLRSKEK